MFTDREHRLIDNNVKLVSQNMTACLFLEITPDFEGYFQAPRRVVVPCSHIPSNLCASAHILPYVKTMI